MIVEDNTKKQDTVKNPQTQELLPLSSLFTPAANILDDGSVLKERTTTPTDPPRGALDYFRLVNGSLYFYNRTTNLWESVGGTTLVSNGTLPGVSSKTFSGLSGDSDGSYQLIFRAEFGSNENSFYMRFNSDSGSNYDTSSAFGQQEIQLAVTAATRFYINMTIAAKSGVIRMVNWTAFSHTNGTVAGAATRGASWLNTTDEITSINISAGSNFQTGTEYWLYKIN